MGSRDRDASLDRPKSVAVSIVIVDITVDNSKGRRHVQIQSSSVSFSKLGNAHPYGHPIRVLEAHSGEIEQSITTAGGPQAGTKPHKSESRIFPNVIAKLLPDVYEP